MAPLDMYRKLRSYYVGKSEEAKPVLTGRTAALLSMLFVAIYVLPFYLSRKTRPSPTLNRDNPSVIRARIQTVTIAVTVSIIATFYLLRVTGSYNFPATFHSLGLYPIDPASIIRTFTLTLILYMAPLYESIYIDQDLSPLRSIPARIKTTLASSQGYRNYIAGPITEELLFRSVLITLHLLAHISATKITFLAPVYFGIAHIHHFYEFRLTHPDTPLTLSLARSVFQFAYTTVFGWYASFIYLRTGNLYAVFIIHAFCNYMGLPRLWGRLKYSPEPSLSSVVTRGKEDVDPIRGTGYGQEMPLVYTVIYYILLFGGVFGFYRNLFTLTESSVALASFSK